MELSMKECGKMDINMVKVFWYRVMDSRNLEYGYKDKKKNEYIIQLDFSLFLIKIIKFNDLYQRI